MSARVRKKPNRYFVGAAACVLCAAACETQSAERAPSFQSDLQGVVVDGYVEGASVFLDLNGNQLRDDDEPAATTDAHGAFSIHVDGIDPDQLMAAFLQAEVLDSAKDADDLGRTLKEAGKSGFTLLSPAGAFVATAADAGAEAAQPAVVSPLSTLVVGEMIARGLSVDDAKDAVQTHLGLEDRDLLRDFVAAHDTVLHNVAHAAAVSLGEASHAMAGEADAGPSDRHGEQVVAAARAVKEQLPQVLDALDLRHEDAPAASVEHVKDAWAEQMMRVAAESGGRGQVGATSDAGVRGGDGRPLGVPTDANGRGLDEPKPPAQQGMDPGAMLGDGRPLAPQGADAGVSHEEPRRPEPQAGDAGVAHAETPPPAPQADASVRPGEPKPPPPQAADAGVPHEQPRPPETQLADAGPHKETAPLAPPSADAGTRGYDEKKPEPTGDAGVPPDAGTGGAPPRK